MRKKIIRGSRSKSCIDIIILTNLYVAAQIMNYNRVKENIDKRNYQTDTSVS